MKENGKSREDTLNDIVSYIGFLHAEDLFCDAAFNCRDGRVLAHKFILGARSRLLLDILEEDELEIYIPDFSIHLVHLLLELIYAGTVCVNQDDAEKINELLTLLGIECGYSTISLPSKKQKLKIKHENNLSSRKPVIESKQCRKKRMFTSNLDINQLTCETCFKVFPKLYKLKNHQLIHLNSFPFICSNCGKGFKNKYKLNAHEKDHKLGLILPEKIKEKKVKEVKEVKDKYFVCKHCGEEFNSLLNRNNHISQTHKMNHSCFHCATKFRHVCPICDKRFKKPSHLEDHQARHNTVGQHACMYCPKRCATQQDLNRHLASHRGEAKFTCQLCFKAFVHRSMYYEHVRKHLGQRPYLCRPCNKSYAQLKCLRQHQKVHERKGDLTLLVTPSKGSRGCHSFIDVISDPYPVNTEQKQKDLNTQEVYIPGPQFTKSTGYKSNLSTGTLKEMQVITDYTEISRIGFHLPENDDNGFQSVVELEQMFPTQVQHNSVQSVLPE
ncbi:zinc finger protein 780B isoform X2 [Eurytemora carolleeae]|uniref:zinc finger protein 780B isoform X2 n=1 Tax=Eurytemora carolleeae TaxID=1294199 RepID=UPI000C75FA1F|nr:zinc finger protein 780B isoform X2 [Eurytemora carolleeae]|eukprot:XP_023337470.1 zinc finger protein 780B-like isoform X2 [Eurytemora affinis]